jgi:predicted RecA/RadA family phage recombinase
LLRSRGSRVIAAAVLAGSMGVGAFAFTTSASAGFPAIKCTTLTGNAANTIVLSGCNGNTGGASMAIPAGSFATGGTIPWVNGQSTTVTLTATAGENSTKGIDKVADPKTGKCAAGSSEYESKGKVTADTTGSTTVGKAAKTEVCLDASQNLTLEPGTVAKI